MKDSDRLDDTEGNGAASELDDMKTRDEFETQVDATEAASRFYHKDIDALDVSAQKKKLYRRILRWNEDHFSGHRKQLEQDENNVVRTRTLCSQLEVTDYQRDRVLHLMEEKASFMGHRGVAGTALAVISLVLNEDGRHVQREDHFETLMDEIGLTYPQLHRLRERNREHL
jgi:hypothetical protein